MLALKQALSLVTIKPVNWTPLAESNLVGWWQFATGITDGGSPNYKVSQWNDQSTNANHFVQGTSGEQPTNGTGATYGVIVFDPSAKENLDTTAQISLDTDFTIGVALKLTSGGGVLLGDNTATGEFIKFFSTSILRIKIDNATAVDLSLDSGSFVGTGGYLVITRVSGLITMNWNGVAQADTETLTGSADIDKLGVRKTNLNPYDGTIHEVMIFSKSNATLTADVNARLSLFV